MERNLWARIGILLGLVFLGLGIWLQSLSGLFENSSEDNLLRVHFIDVGQGDAIFIQTPDGAEAIIDGGRNAGVLRELSSLLNIFDTEIDLLIATHPDADHIGGLVDVLERYKINTIVHSSNQADSPTFEAYEDAVEEEAGKVIIAQAGQRIKLGASTTIEVLTPVGDATDWRSNAASIVVQVRYGDVEFMLTGDAPSSIEDYLASTYGASLESEVLKLGHHGSETSSSKNFLDAVSPQYAVVSAGIDNQYNHPHQSVMQRVFARNIKTFHTGLDGTVTFATDGEKVWVE